MKPLVAAWLVLLCLHAACAQDDEATTSHSNVAVGKRGNLSRLASSDIFIYVVAGIGGLCLLACCSGCIYTAFFAGKGKDASDASAPLDPNRRVPGRMRRIAEANDKKRAQAAAAGGTVDLYEAPPVDEASTAPDAATGTCVVAIGSDTAAAAAAAPAGASTSQASSLSTSSSRSSTRPLTTRAPSMGRGGAASLRDTSPLAPPRRAPNADAFADGIEC